MSALKRNLDQSTESTDVNAKIDHLQQEYRTLMERHKILDTIVPRWDECTGIIREMISIENEMKKLQESINQLEADRLVA